GTGTRSGRSQPAVELRRDGPPPALPVRGLDQRWPLGSDVDDEVLPTLRRPAEAVDEGGPQGRGDRALLGIGRLDPEVGGVDPAAGSAIGRILLPDLLPRRHVV